MDGVYTFPLGRNGEEAAANARLIAAAPEMLQVCEELVAEWAPGGIFGDRAGVPASVIFAYDLLTRIKGIMTTPTIKQPSIKTLERQMSAGYVKATDGCKVEPDGECQHGHVSWLIYLGMI